MDDINLPPKDRKTDGPTDNNASRQAAQNSDEDNLSSKQEHLVSVLEIIGGLVFVTVAVALDSAGFHVASLVFGFLAVVCGLAIAAHYCGKVGLRHHLAWFILAVFASALLFWYLVWHTVSTESHAIVSADLHANRENQKAEWLPPELPTNCSNVTVVFGNQGIVFAKSFAEISPETNGSKIPIRDAPEIFTRGLDQMPGYSPRKRDMFVKYQMQETIDGHAFDYPAVPYIVSNRLFVEVTIPFLNERRKIVMSDDFDSELSKLPARWDRNYSTERHAYEIVNEDTNPVLQVVYVSPDVIFISGIFTIGTNSLIESFGGNLPRFWSVTTGIITNDATPVPTNIIGSNDFRIVYTNVFRTNLTEEMIRSAFYVSPFEGRHPLFKYPSNKNPGAFADWVQLPPHQK